MGGMVGMYHFDGRPVDPLVLERMAESIRHRGPDGIGYWIGGPLGMAHLRLWTTPESMGEKQPMAGETGDLRITLHGRVDNRDEVIAALESRGFALRTGTDAEIVLHAYRAWAERCPEHIIGDFAFVIWDASKRHLFCARDSVGIKPFYYYLDQRRFVWASEFNPFFEAGDIPMTPNEGRVAEYLTQSMASMVETLYTGIMRLPPAHYMVVAEGQARIARYWGLESVKDIRYRTDAEYAGHFLELFKRVIRNQMRAHGRVGADLSGGLDSSSVVSTVAALFQDGTLEDTGFEVFSLVLPGSPDADETSYIQEVIQKWGLKANSVDPRPLNTHPTREDARFHRYFPFYPNGTMANPLSQIARDKGFRVLLTGLGGDNWFAGSRYRYADMLRGFQVIGLIRQLYDDYRQWGIGRLTRHPLVRFGVVPLLSPRLYQALRRLLGRPDQAAIPAFIPPAFAARTCLLERNRESTGDWCRYASLAQAHHYFTTAEGWNPHAFEMVERLMSRFGLEHRHPFLHREVVAFGLGIPDTQRARRNVTKHVLREAMRGLLPEAVRQRRTKAEFSELSVLALEANGGAGFFEALAIEQIGWVIGEQARDMYRQMRERWTSGDRAVGGTLWTLWTVMGLEFWYREVIDEPIALGK